MTLCAAVCVTRLACCSDTLGDDPQLGPRSCAAALRFPPVALGPLAVDGGSAGSPGLLLAGDAAGFIDPMTGDGLRFAFRGGELAAAAALDGLEHGVDGVHRRLAQLRRREFAPKRCFNRTLRALVASPAAVRGASMVARVVPAAFRLAVTIAGDVPGTA